MTFDEQLSKVEKRLFYFQGHGVQDDVDIIDLRRCLRVIKKLREQRDRLFEAELGNVDFLKVELDAELLKAWEGE